MRRHWRGRSGQECHHFIHVETVATVVKLRVSASAAVENQAVRVAIVADHGGAIDAFGGEEADVEWTL